MLKDLGVIMFAFTMQLYETQRSFCDIKNEIFCDVKKWDKAKYIQYFKGNTMRNNPQKMIEADPLSSELTEV